MQKGKITIKARVDEDTLAMNYKPATIDRDVSEGTPQPEGSPLRGVGGEGSLQRLWKSTPRAARDLPASGEGIVAPSRPACYRDNLAIASAITALRTLDRSLMSEAEWTRRARISPTLKAWWAALAAGRTRRRGGRPQSSLMEIAALQCRLRRALTEDGITSSTPRSCRRHAGAGRSRRCGACAIRSARARAVMERSDCVLMTGEAADAFMARNGLRWWRNGSLHHRARIRGLEV
jgi:hypothetical protein